MEATQTQNKPRNKTLELTYIAIFAALTAVCAWISIPLTVSFTMQTFAVFLALYTLGGKRATMMVVVYLLLGAIGVPVFAGFSGGIGCLLGTTGGYLVGFLVITLLYWAVTSKFGYNRILCIATMVVGLFLCYALGTAWYVIVYGNTVEAIGVGVALSWCVTPFIIPDLVKIALAFLIGDRIKRHVKL